eukprot:630639-Heterocapsa_arctica.AAC.1
MGQGPTDEKRFIITVVKKSQLLKDGSTLNAMFKVVAWSMNALLQGLRPTHDEHGAALAPGEANGQ